jgi:hypothetical protein
VITRAPLATEPWFWPAVFKLVIFGTLWWCVLELTGLDAMPWLHFFLAALLGVVTLIFFDTWWAKREERALAAKLRGDE